MPSEIRSSQAVHISPYHFLSIEYKVVFEQSISTLHPKKCPERCDSIHAIYMYRVLNI